MQKDRFIIIDGNAIIHRAYHALPPMTTKDGTIVNAVFGFSSMLLKVMADLKPTHLAVAFDLPGPTFRDEIFEDYKATRERADQDLYDQIPIIHELVEIFDIPIYTKEGFEADDVIGTIAAHSKKEMQTIIVTGDKDLLQLVDGNKAEVYLLKRGLSDFELYDDAAVHERFGFGPEMVPDYKGLMGDPSDNIPGVAGVGKKTASMLIQGYGSVEDIYEKLDAGALDVKPGVLKKLTEQKKEAELSKELATIVTDIDDLGFALEDTAVNTFDPEEVRTFFTQHEFFSLIKRIPGNKKKSKPKAVVKQKKVDLQMVVNKQTFGPFWNLARDAERVVMKEVLRENDPLTAEVLGVVAELEGKTFFLDFLHLAESDQEKVWSLFAKKKLQIIGHDLKPLIKQALRKQVQISCTLFDVMIASYVAYGSTRRHDFASILERDLGLRAVFSEQQESLFGIDVQPLAQDIGHVIALKDLYTKELKDMESMQVFEDIEMPLIPILAQMELVGMAVDTQLLKDMSADAHTVLEGLQKKIWKAAGQEFNVASSVQLRDILFDVLKLPTKGIKKGKTGYSTAASELEKLREEHEIIDLIEEFREVEKIRNTYVDVLPTLVHKETNRIHSSFNQAVTATGRLSSSDPNMQNIPIRTELGRKVREAFVAGEGKTLVVADYSQIELRIAAHLSGDEKMIHIFEEGQDVHAATAAVINNVELSEVTKDMRSAAKAVNFGVLFGMGAFGLASRTGISNADAKVFIEKYYEAFSGLREYLDETIEQARKTGYTETLFGRRRYVPELESANYQMRSAGERIAINMPIQGTEADMMKIAMIDVKEALLNAELGPNKGVHLILQVHDELVLEAPIELSEQVKQIVEEAMEQVVELSVPVVVDACSGQSWGKMK